MTYQEAEKLTAKRMAKKVANNTWLYKCGFPGNEHFEIVLYSTAVVKIWKDRTYTLFSGGWRSVTTKQRLNNFSPAKVWQKNFEWFVGMPWQPGGECVEFVEGIRVDSKGKVIHEQTESPVAR